MNLLNNTFLQRGKYKIEKVLGQGGFGITYLAIQSGLERKVAIKEFFMKELCERDETTNHVLIGTEGSRESVNRFREKFLKEARTLANMVHPNIVRVIDVFEENGTAYYVMDYVEGESLSELVKRNGALSEAVALNYIRQVANALSYIHAKSINHLDIKPANIMIRQSDSTAVLIDFGLSKQYDTTGGQTSSTPIGISDGYAPLEQYQAGGVSSFTPQTDIYSLGATLFYLVTGKVPPSASEVLNEGLPTLPAHVSASTQHAISQAMLVRKLDRPESVSVFLGLLSNQQTTKLNEKVTKPRKTTKAVKKVEEETKIIESTSASAEPGKKVARKPRKKVGDSDSCGPAKRDVLNQTKDEETKILPSDRVNHSYKPYVDLKKHEKESNKARVNIVGACFLAILLVILFVCFNGSEDKINNNQSNKQSSAIVESKQTIVKDGQTRKSKEANSGISSSAVSSSTENQDLSSTGKAKESREDLQNKQTNVAQVVEEVEVEETIYQVVEQQPEFPGGMNALLQFLNANVHYPEAAMENGVQGRVIVQFVVNKDGSIVDVVVPHPTDPFLDKEAIRVVSSMPKWKPGMERGKPVRCRFTMPVNFKLQ